MSVAVDGFDIGRTHFDGGREHSRSYSQCGVSNIVGVILTPLLVSFLMHATGHSGEIGPLLIEITMLTLLVVSTKIMRVGVL
ncbi:MAG TPA: hypothetical protein VHS80_01690 [Chthoniobacterales bacterium]|nr:hypothetical protein [Chthoniobacterales bacterium]